MSRSLPRVLVAVWLAMLVAAVPAPATAAPSHPLGNFTVSHYNGLTLTPDGIELLTVIDSAEIPTQQGLSDVDADGDGQMSPAELAEHAAATCPQARQQMHADIGGDPLTWRAQTAEAETVPGSAGLPTLRMTCRSYAEADLSTPASLSFRDDYRSDRIGWREISAVGVGVALQSSVPSESVSEELRSYPEDLLTSPLDVRSAAISFEPGKEQGNAGSAADLGVPGFTGDDPLSRLVTAGDRQLDYFIGDRELTPVLGTVALLLAVLLGAGHAVLPGHGKTVMAAYLAGRRGRPRDALIVGATVTGTHTVGVLLLGLALTITSAFAGEQALRVLGIISGILITAIGISLVREARAARRAHAQPEAVLAHAHRSGHGHAPIHDHVPTEAHTPGPEHSHGHTHPHTHAHGHPHHHGSNRRGLIGMGVAGGLVPSPSALVVLLGSVALGRTIFGVLLVFAYGLGMAATLTAVGLVLVRLRMRLDDVEANQPNRLASTLTSALPLVTAVLVLLVGVGLVARGLFFSL
ncbi:MAG: hypothetical protein WA892_01000 [Ornithinimicrobium sp.]